MNNNSPITNAYVMQTHNSCISNHLQVYQDGFRNLNLSNITRHLAVPVCSTLLFALTCPYFVAAGIVPLLGK